MKNLVHVNIYARFFFNTEKSIGTYSYILKLIPRCPCKIQVHLYFHMICCIYVYTFFHLINTAKKRATCIIHI